MMLRTSTHELTMFYVYMFLGVFDYLNAHITNSSLIANNKMSIKMFNCD